ncbi:Nitroreductase family protein [Frankineae bacterium MT45]|nr:Nitroreductase family protein [Frankineae bacterium MT45]
MTAIVASQRLALRAAAVQATLAPSVHNTQPWSFVVTGDALEIHADWSRKLRVLDPLGRQLLLSCGCALMNARVSLAAAGFDAAVERFPDPTRPGLIARLTLLEPSPDRLPLAALEPIVELRQTNRRSFADDPVPDTVISTLIEAARAESARLQVVESDADRRATAELCQRADREQNADPAYRAELRAWTSDDSKTRDGVDARTVPRSGGDDSSNDVPIRDFDTRLAGGLPAQQNSNRRQCLLVLATAEDDPLAWVRGGEALERVLLEVTRQGFVASPMTQVVEIPRTRYLLRTELKMPDFPHILLRVGRAAKAPASRRRLLVDVLREDD